MNLKKTVRLQTVLSALMVSSLTIALLGVIVHIVPVQPTLGSHLLELNRAQTQSANAVTSVVTYFRGLDTLGEVTILFLSIFGIGIGIDRSDRMRTILHYDNSLLKIGARVLFPVMILFGAYIILHGHLSPGGGFQGGVVIASAFLLMFLAEGDAYDLDHRIMSLFEALSGAGFVLLGVLGVFLGGLFLSNPLPLGRIGALFSGGAIGVIYLFVGLKVASEITLLIEYFIRTNDARDA
jgi:multicomponent Na+:H+ antiporter subunit B